MSAYKAASKVAHPRSPDDLTRRNFLQLAGIGLGALLLPGRWLEEPPASMRWPELRLEDLPSNLQEILSLVPRTGLGKDGYLRLYSPEGRIQGRVPFAQTQWNKDNSTPSDRLYGHLSWAIMLHWYGDKENYRKTVKGYLQGFDSLRTVEDYITRTSAHFLVGSAPVKDQAESKDNEIGILQTQAPDKDGVPFVASHLRPVNHQAHLEQRQYFVRALYTLNHADPAVHSVLQDIYDGRKADPNMRTIAIEICGYKFEDPEHYPPPQQIANVVSLVSSTMKRYGIPASNILGHHEIQLSKPDPGKKFLSLIRYLVGLKALLDDDPALKTLVFGQFIDYDGGPAEAVQRYFKFVYDYLVMVSSPVRVYEWEAASQYWLAMEPLFAGKPKLALANEFCGPILEATALDGFKFLEPTNHEGIDLYRRMPRQTAASAVMTDIHLIANGACVHLGRCESCHQGQTALFRHRQPDGAEVISVYSHMQDLHNLRVGVQYPVGTPVGMIRTEPGRPEGFLHFALAYGAAWQTDLHRSPIPPLNAGESWIRSRYLQPTEYMQQRL